ncbi:RecX family transcriptional regulator [Candidatus Fermentibacterales bacterium]|nr:RecX family transcriptional regulator [Candidatus Fermentibacterales bacterium]
MAGNPSAPEILLTAIEPVRPGWLLLVSGSGQLLVPENMASSEGLCPGRPVDMAGLERRACPAQSEAARRDLGRYLGSRERTSAMLRDYLSRRRLYCDRVVEETVTFALEHGLVDDDRFARLAADQAARGSGSLLRGRAGLARRLRQSGVGRGAAEKALAGFDEEEALPSVVEKLRRLYGRFESDVRTRRARAWMQRRGFSGDSIRRVMLKLREQSGERGSD